MEAVLVILAIGYGIFAIYLASVRPFVVVLTTGIGTVPEPLSLDTGDWRRATNVSGRFVFGVPPGWVLDATALDRTIMARDRQHLLHGGPDAIVIETRYVDEDTRVEDVALRESALARPSLYDISVHGRPGIFAVEFTDGRIARQTVYIGVGDRIYVFRASVLDPAVFSTFISTVRFLPDIAHY